MTSNSDLSKKSEPLDLQCEIYIQQSNLLKDKALYRFEREMNLTQFKELMLAFQEKSSYGGKLTIDEFKKEFGKILQSQMSEEQISLILMRIGIRGEYITWDDFCNFMLLRAQEQGGAKDNHDFYTPSFFPSKRFGVERPLVTPHKETICGLYHLSSYQRYMTVSRDATLCYWSESFKLQKCFTNFIRTSSHLPLLDSSATNKNQLQTSFAATDQLNQVWVTSYTFLSDSKKWVFATDTHELFFYDYMTFQLIAKMNLNSIVLCMDYYYYSSNDDIPSGFKPNEGILFLGDDLGEVTILYFNPEILFLASILNPQKVIQLDKHSFSFVFKKKVHNDWVKQIRYVANFNSLFTISPDPKDSLACGLNFGQKWRFSSSPVNKGINAFGVCNFPVALVTGGADRNLRLWNPRRLLNPQASLRGHTSPISDIQVNPSFGQCVSLSTDKIIKIWDIRSQTCIQTLTSSFHHRLDDYFSFLSVVPQPNGTVRLFCGNNLLLEYIMERAPSKMHETSHPSPIRSVMCNPICNMTVSLCDSNFIHVWDFKNGALLFKLGKNTLPPEVTCIGFDSYSGYRRLLIGSGDGRIFLTSIEGHTIFEMVKKNTKEISCVLHVETQNGRFFVAGGWQRHIYIFKDDNNVTTHVQTPSEVWNHSSNMEEKETEKEDDITSMVFFPPDSLIYSTFNGHVWICNMTGTIMGKMKSEIFCTPKTSQGCIDNLVLISDNAEVQLASTHSQGYIQLWNVHTLNLIEIIHSHGVTSLCSFKGYLASGDTQGQITVWNIQNLKCCFVEYQWYGHVMKGVNSIDVFFYKNQHYLITGASDGQLRCWLWKGELVGTFGVGHLWDLDYINTWHSLPSELKLHQAAMLRNSATSEHVPSKKNQRNENSSHSPNDNGTFSLSFFPPLSSSITSSSNAPSKFTLDPLMTTAPSYERVLHTADLLKKGRRSWFSKSQFAQTHIQKAIKELHSPKPTLSNIASSMQRKQLDIERVFHFLPEYPLKELKTQSFLKLGSNISTSNFFPKLSSNFTSVMKNSN